MARSSVPVESKPRFRFWCNLAGMGLGYLDQQLWFDVRGSGKQVDAADGTVGHTRLPSDPWCFQLGRSKESKIAMQFQFQEGRPDVTTLRDAGGQFHALFSNDGAPAFHFGEYQVSESPSGLLCHW